MNEQIRREFEQAIKALDDLFWLAHGSITAGDHARFRSAISTVAAHARYAGSGEAIAEVVSKHGDPESFGERELKLLTDIQKLPYGTKLYTHPPAQPQVPDGYALVPVEPTPEMLSVNVSPLPLFRNGNPHDSRVQQWRRAIYKSMIAIGGES